MDFKKYNKLRKKIKQKDFEGNYKELDKWLFIFSFIGNIGSIFFAYFLVYPNLYEAISINLTSGIWVTILSFIFTNVFLVTFEIIKRYILRSFSFNFTSNRKNNNSISTITWLVISISIISLSFYLSIIGSRNLATTKTYSNNIIETETSAIVDSISDVYDNKKEVFVLDNNELRSINNDLRQRLTNTPLYHTGIRKQYQANIDKNMDMIEYNQKEIDFINTELNNKINALKLKLSDTKSDNENADDEKITLFIIIAVFCEITIFTGIYFREYFEYHLYILNQHEFRKIHEKKDRYKLITQFIFLDGKLSIGDKVISVNKLKTLISGKTSIQSPNKFIDEYFNDMENLDVFSIAGRRRIVAMEYDEAMDIIEKFDDTLRILENLK